MFTHLAILETNSGENKQKQEKSLQFAELDKAGRRATSESRQEIDKRAETVLHAYTKTR
ncbi:hypothetical protein CGSMWGv55152_02668 [Gardnerella vaginalis 55152]|uniref:Uncharacterized protein n=1 Tax=Gardnerella vaginalis 55152 TaxID=698955 RepID=I4LU18_GARVA|nr:hypothetical protein CGSMWGv55152_02668 [Gardnerella vaginalis 55152]